MPADARVATFAPRHACRFAEERDRVTKAPPASRNGAMPIVSVILMRASIEDRTRHGRQR